MKTIFGEKDIANVRNDMMEADIRQHLWLQPSERRRGDFIMPHAPYVMKDNERQGICGGYQEDENPHKLCKCTTEASVARWKDARTKVGRLSCHDAANFTLVLTPPIR